MAPDPRLLRAQRFPLHAAVEDGNLQNVLLVLKTEKSRINKKFEDSQQTALHVASSNATKDIVQELLKAGANIDEEDVVRQTALHYSVNNRDLGVTDLLIQEGAKIDPRRCRDGWTPLFIAAIFGNAKATRSLVNSGADVLLADNEGKGAEDWAANYRQHEVCKILRAAPRKVTESSGKLYVDTGPVQPKKEVEFDAGMNLLMKKIEEKRKARLAKPKSAEQNKLDNERLNERISEVKEEVELVVHKLKDQDPKQKEKTEEELKTIEEAKRMLSQKRMECILEKERREEERLKAQREDEEKSQKEQEVALKSSEEEKLRAQQDDEEKIRKEKEMKEKIQLQKEKEDKLRIQKEKEDEEKRQKAIEQNKLKALEEFRRKEEEKEIKRLEKEKRINAKQKKLEEEKENKKQLEDMKKQELERLKNLKEERERIHLEEESKLREKQKMQELEEKERLEKEKQRAKEMAEKIELDKKKKLEELEKQEQERQKQIKEEKEKICLEKEIKLQEKKKKLALEEKERQEKKKKQEIEEKERLEKEKQKVKEMAEELELKKKKQLEELQKQEQEHQKLIKEEKERICLDEEIKLKEKKKKLELEQKERLEKEKQKENDEQIRIQREKEDDERRKIAIEQKKLKELEAEEIKLKERKKTLELEEKERLEKEKEKMKLEKEMKIKTKLEEIEKEKEMKRKREKEKEKEMDEEKKKIDEKKVKVDLDEKKIKEDREKEKERIKVEQRNYQEEKLRHNEMKEKEKENQKLVEEEMKKERKRENQSEIGELHLDKGKKNIRAMNTGGIQEFNREIENPNEVIHKDSTFKEKIIKEVKDIEKEALELEEILKKESNFQEIVPSACQALNDDIKFNKKEIKIKTYDTVRGSKKFDEESNDWKVSKSKNIIFEDDDTEESSEISDQISISESSSMDMIEEKMTNRWRGITPLKDLSISEEMKKLEEEKIKMEKERRLKSIQRKRKIQKENARMEQRRLKELETLKQIEQDNDRYENERRQKEIDMLRILKEAQEDIEKSEKQLDKKNKRRQTDIQKDFDEETAVIKELEYNRLKKEMRQNEIQKNFDDEIKEIRERRFKRDIDRQKQEEEEETYLIGNHFKSEDRVKHKGISKMKEDGEEEYMHFLISQQGKPIENIVNDKKVKKDDQEVNVLYNTSTEDSQDITYLERQKNKNGCKFLEKSPLVGKSKLLNEVVDNIESFAVGNVNLKDKDRKNELRRNEELYLENTKFEEERRKRKQKENIKLLKEQEKIEQKLIDLKNMEQYEDEIKFNINDEIDKGKVESVNDSEFDRQIFETKFEQIKKKKRELEFLRIEQLEEEKSKIKEQRRIKNHGKKLKLQEEKQNIEKKLNDLENLYRLDSPESCTSNDDHIDEDVCSVDINKLINMPVNKEVDQNFEMELERIKKKRSELDSIRKEQLADEKNKIEELRKVKNQERNKKLQDEKENIERKLCDIERFNRFSGQEKVTDVPDEIEEETYNIDESMLVNVDLVNDLDEERLWIEESKKNKELKRKEQLELENIKREEERKFRHLKQIKKLEDEQNKIDERWLRDLKTIKNLEDENQSLEKEIGDNKLEIAKRIQDETLKREEQIFLKNRNRIKEEDEDRARIEKRKREIELGKQKLLEDEKKLMEEEKSLNSLKRKKRQEEEQARIDQRRNKELEKIKLLEEENQRLESKKMKEIEVLKKLEYEQKKIMEEKKRIELQKKREKEEEFERIQKEKLQKRIDEQLEIEMEQARIQKEKKLKYIEKQKQLAEENEKIEKETRKKREKDMQFQEQLSKEIAIVEKNKLEEMEKLKQYEEDRKQLEEKKRKDKEEKEKLMDIANDKYKMMQRTKELQKLEKENLRIEERRQTDLKKIQELENENNKIIHEKPNLETKDNSHIEEIDKIDIMTNETEINRFKQNEKDYKEDKHKENDVLYKALPKIKSGVEEKETLSKLKEKPSDNVATMLDSENHDDNGKLSSRNELIISNASEKIHETKDKDFEIKNRMENGIKYSEFNTTDIKEGVIEKVVTSKQLNITSNNDHKMNLDKTISKKDNCNSSTEISVMEDGNLNIENIMETKSFNTLPHINENGLEIQNLNYQTEKKSSTDVENGIISKKISPTEDDKELLEKAVTSKPVKQSPHPIEQTHENSNECYIMEKKSVQEIENNKISKDLVNRGDIKIIEKNMESSCIENAGIENKEISQELPVFENSDTIITQQSNSKKGYMVGDHDKSNLDNKKNTSVEKYSVLQEQENSHEIHSIDKQKESIVDLIFESDIGDSDLIRNKMQQVVHEPCKSTKKKLSEHNIQIVSQFTDSLDKSESVIENSKSSPTISTNPGIQINQKEIFDISEPYKCDKDDELLGSDKNSDSNPDSENNDTSRTQKDCSLFPDLKGNDITQANIESDVIEDRSHTIFQSDIDPSCNRKDDELPKLGTDSSSPSINSQSKNIPSDSKQHQQLEVEKNNSSNAYEIPNAQQSLHQREEDVSPSCDNVQILSTPSGRLQEILTSSLPDEVEDPEFNNRIQVFNNYKQFGAMYASKNNWKKAEWAYATGIKQVIDVDKPAKSKHQLQTVLQTEVEFRIQRASALQALGRVSEAVSECRTVLTINKDDQEAVRLIRDLQSNIYDARPSGR